MNNQCYENDNHQGWDINRSYGVAPVKPAYDHTILLRENARIQDAITAKEDVRFAEMVGMLFVTTDFFGQLQTAVREYVRNAPEKSLLLDNPEPEVIAHWARDYVLVREQLLMQMRSIFGPNLIKHRALALGRDPGFISMLVNYLKYENLIWDVLQGPVYKSADNASRDEYFDAIRKATYGFGLEISARAFEEEDFTLDGYGHKQIEDFLNGLFNCLYHGNGDCAILDEYCTRVFTLIRQYWALSELAHMCVTEKGLQYYLARQKVASAEEAPSDE